MCIAWASGRDQGRREERGHSGWSRKRSVHFGPLVSTITLYTNRFVKPRTRVLFLTSGDIVYKIRGCVIGPGTPASNFGSNTIARVKNPDPRHRNLPVIRNLTPILAFEIYCNTILTPTRHHHRAAGMRVAAAAAEPGVEPAVRPGRGGAVEVTPAQ